MNSVAKGTLAFLLAVALLLQAGCTVKRDCRGRIKHKLSNGVWI